MDRFYDIIGGMKPLSTIPCSRKVCNYTIDERYDTVRLSDDNGIGRYWALVDSKNPHLDPVYVWPEYTSENALLESLPSVMHGIALCNSSVNGSFVPDGDGEHDVQRMTDFQCDIFPAVKKSRFPELIVSLVKRFRKRQGIVWSMRILEYDGTVIDSFTWDPAVRSAVICAEIRIKLRDLLSNSTTCSRNEIERIIDEFWNVYVRPIFFDVEQYPEKISIAAENETKEASCGNDW